ncbi:GFA family protein [Salinisphaera sp. SPP-AMP-43]|uniref:GFA family protein n=1 Tax=Salinisphaera sp. SPP-AMP-43 TaxID=3121288 RepID=UPI003C6E6FDC
MKTTSDNARLEGRCHCGSVVFRVRLSDGLRTARRCDCSYCQMRGYVAVSAELNEFEITAGAQWLSLYQFGTQTAQHYFCSRCGIHTHHRRRSKPTQYGVNAACLDGISPYDFPQVPVNNGADHPRDRSQAGGRKTIGTLRFVRNDHSCSTAQHHRSR